MAVVKHPEVVCTELEDGAVLLNMETRLYYSLNGTALAIWQLVGSVPDAQGLARELAARFDLEDGDADAVARFLEQLERERLVVSGEPAADGPAPPAATDGARTPFAEPELVRHDEPLHEVSVSPFDPQLPLAE